MITTSKYEENGFADIISGLVKMYEPKVVVELGTQQGASAIIIGKALRHGGKLYTYDLFEEKYFAPPYAKTHASKEAAEYYIFSAGIASRVEVRTKDALQVYQDFNTVDILHIDLCNWYNTISVLLGQWRYKVNQAIILEGGGHNKWQRELGFRPFFPLLKKWLVRGLYNVTIFKKNEDYALTILTRKSYDTNVQSEYESQSSTRCDKGFEFRDDRGGAEGSGVHESSEILPGAQERSSTKQWDVCPYTSLETCGSAGR